MHLSVYRRAQNFQNPDEREKGRFADAKKHDRNFILKIKTSNPLRKTEKYINERNFCTFVIIFHELV